MLLLETEIYFYTKDESKECLDNDLDTKNVLRPSINFGNDLLFSCTVRVDKGINKIVRGNYYNSTLEMFTIDEESYPHIKELLFKGHEFKIQVASKVVGYGKIIDYLYEK